MRVVNFTYEDGESLKNKLILLKEESNIFIQIFCGAREKDEANSLVKSILSHLPQAKILVSSSFAEISDGNFYKNKTSICVSIFKKTTIKTMSFKENNPLSVADEITSKLISPNTKLLIVFGNTMQFNTNKLLYYLTKNIPHIIVAGGNASDDLAFKNTFVGTNEGISDVLLACAVLDSDVLQVFQDYIFEYVRIGLDMVVTECEEGGIIKKINNTPIIDIYKRYLGKYIADTLPENGYEFPLTFYDGDLLVGRSAFIRNQDGSLRYGGDVKKGTKVKFGVASSLDVVNGVSKKLAKLATKNIDAFYVYSCVSRYLYSKDTVLDYNIKAFNNIAPMSGFFTYGEIYHTNDKNYILNNTNTYIALSEGINEPKTNTIHELEPKSGIFDVIIYGLRNLSFVSNNDYLEVMSIFKQYKDLLEKSLILVYFNNNGEIIDANNLFLKISKYKREEIIGKKFSSLISKDSINNIDNIWNVIKSRETFQGVLKNKSADSSSFYTKTIIKPIINSKDEVMLYVCTMDDITELEINKQNLQNSVNILTEVSLQKDNVIENYQTLLDRSTAMVRIKGERFIDVNKSCEDMFGYTKIQMLDKHISLIFKPSKDIPNILNTIKNVLREKGYAKFYLNCIDSKNNPLYVQIYLMAIKSSPNSSTYDEAIAILHNVTELFKMQQELEDVQKEVLYAMGTISEGRSRETGNHIKRVAEYTYLLANLYGLDKKQAELLKIASPMHDIGKLAIPDAILNKPGKLTDEEFDIMKTHAQKGYDMLCWSNRAILKTAAEIALTHHEWWNGKGYPRGLRGEEIPLCGRIVAVADVFDALSQDRCYKKAWPINEVIEHMVKNKDIQFDGRIIDLLVKNIDDFLNIKTIYEDKF
ncbi:HD domain-containing phosphohydrolase [Helicobacter sp. MIT 14-3879]|uniref:HD domain-containing phosphohydrolase n=1 Tax=Helicobacter sp. MIT 14-3879 TaxID=2040649 RepID=UPI000E1F6E2C|nr:HD domain-containing phosphohydrolase [Helicobacter sp. MIT 14-3879]RDU65420.1 hypothetical protein CQA44_00045 [Helicobacter sp. MIT 14-3879]